MNQQEITSSLTSINNSLQNVIEDSTETTSAAQIVVRSFLGTSSENGTVISEQIPAEINKNKPWREVIKRSFIYGGSDN